MKEYKTLKIAPEDEVTAIRYLETFGWKLEETREVYNESQEVVGEKYTAYGGFMQGLTGNDGRVDVETRTNVTHFLSMRFMRETTMKNYDKLSALQNEYDRLEIEPLYDMPKKPILMTIIGLFGCFSIFLPIGAIASWIKYASDKKKVVAHNETVQRKNPQTRQRIQQIIAEASKLVEESNAA